MGGGGKKKKKQKKTRSANQADRHLLYQKSVQAPDVDIVFFADRFRERRGREPAVLREDFCGTALLSAHWLREGPERRALSVDIDTDTLAWGRRHNFSKAELKRVDLRCADVREVDRPKADLACAMNFSFCVFKTRPDLGAYFTAVHHGLRKDGIFLLELYGGTEAIQPIAERREVEDFVFVWEQERYNPITNETLCHIHFEFADGSKLKKAFTYDWRLWTVPEVRELLADAGFRSTDVYWERVDDNGEGTGEYVLTEEEENQEGWLVYVVAAR